MDRDGPIARALRGERVTVPPDQQEEYQRLVQRRDQVQREFGTWVGLYNWIAIPFGHAHKMEIR